MRSKSITNLVTKESLSRIAIGVSAILYLLSWQFSSGKFASGLDPSYIYGLNVASSHGLIFGRDLFFTYGPLGYLLEPLHISGHWYSHVIFLSVVYVLIAVASYQLAIHQGKVWISTAWLTLLCLFTFSNDFTRIPSGFFLRSSVLSLASILMYLTCLTDSRGRLWIVAVLLAGITLYIKFNMGVCLGLLHVLFCALSAFDQGSGLRKAIIRLFSYTAIVSVVGLICIGHTVAWRHWLDANFLLSARFSEAMSLWNESKAWKALLLLPAVAYLLYQVTRKITAPRIFLVLSALLVLFFSFKEGYVREDNHVVYFWSSVAPVIGLMLFFDHSRKTWLVVLCSVCLSLWAVKDIPGSLWPAIKNVTSSSRISGKVFSALDIVAGTRPEPITDTYKAVSPSTNAYPDLVGQTVNVLPYDVSLLKEHNWIWKPFRVFQIYQAYDPVIDKVHSSDVESGRSAQWVYWHGFQDIDGRYLPDSAPLTMLSLMRHYEYDHFQDQALVLQKRSKVVNMGLRFIKKDQTQLWQELDVPSSRHLVLARIHLRYTLFGKLWKAFFRAPFVVATFKDTKGLTFGRRLLPGMAQNGVFANQCWNNLEDVAFFWNTFEISQKPDSFTSFTVQPMTRLPVFEKFVEVEFYEWVSFDDDAKDRV